ncbi:hypothetical protein ACFLZG_03365 [Thermodesulfobacteriota bacterium]
MKNRLLGIGLALAICILALLLKDFVRNGILIPLLEIFQLIKDLPQIVIWIFFIGIMLIPAFKSLDKLRPHVFERRGGKMMAHVGKIEEIARLIRNAHSSKGYFRERLARYLGEFSVDVLAYREKLSREIIMDHLESGSLDAPLEIRHYLRAGLLGDLSQKNTLDLDPIRLVEFLEQQLEVDNDTQNR